MLGFLLKFDTVAFFFIWFGALVMPGGNNHGGINFNLRSTLQDVAVCLERQKHLHSFVLIMKNDLTSGFYYIP